MKQLRVFDAGEAYVQARLLPAEPAFTKGPSVTEHRTLPAPALVAGQIATFLVVAGADLGSCGVQYECRLCLTLHNNEGNYLAHTQVSITTLPYLHHTDITFISRFLGDLRQRP